MNRHVLGVGLLLMAAVAAYPPFFFATPGVAESRRSTHRQPLWEQPPVGSTGRVDWSRLTAEWAALGALAVGAATLAGRRPAGPVE